MTMALLFSVAVNAEAERYTFTKIADTSDSLAFATSVPVINNGGTVAFTAFKDGVLWGVFSGSGGPIITIAASSGPLGSFFDLSINAAGTVAFVSGIDVAGHGVFTGSGGPLTTIADNTSGPFNNIGFTPSINS